MSGLYVTESNLWKMNQVMALCFSVPHRDHLSKLGKRIAYSTNSNLNVKYYTDQSMISQFIPYIHSINIEKRAEEEINNYSPNIYSE